MEKTMMKKKEPSPVIQLISLVWENAGGDKNVFSWELYNHQVCDAAILAAAGFPWSEGDMHDVMGFGNSRYSIAKCFHVEHLYSEAVVHRNISACREIERYLEREPIIADNVDGRKRDRLHVGAQTFWNGEKVWVNSFKPDGRANACSYKDDYKRSVKHKYVISAADVKSARKAAKKETQKGNS